MDNFMVITGNLIAITSNQRYFWYYREKFMIKDLIWSGHTIVANSKKKKKKNHPKNYSSWGAASGERGV